MTFVMSWLGRESSFFADNPAEANVQQMHDRVNRGIGDPDPDPVGEARRAKNNILLFVGRRAGQVVTVGFAQFGAENGVVQKFGVSTPNQRLGVGTATFRWLLGGLHGKHASKVIVLGVFKSNAPMLGLMRKLGATAPGAEGWWATPAAAADLAAKAAVMLRLDISQTCTLLGVPVPNGDRYNLHGVTVDDVTFDCLYFGRHPRRLKRGEHPIVWRI